MSSSCITQNCSQGCCNIYGYCPTPFGTSLQQNCYYYYYNIWAFWWIYFVIVISSLLYCVIVIACIVACVRRRRMNGQDTIIIAQDQALMPQYQYQYGQYGKLWVYLQAMGHMRWGAMGSLWGSQCTWLIRIRGSSRTISISGHDGGSDSVI